MFDADKTRMIGLPYGEKTDNNPIPECHGRTDRIAISIYRASVCWRAIKHLPFQNCLPLPF